MEKAFFSFERYVFSEAHLMMSEIPDECALGIHFHPRGQFDPQTKIFSLVLEFKASYDKEKQSVEVIKVVLEADFVFNDIADINDIPDYFYPNSLAIIYPYIRSFISTLTLQANVHPIVLPTMNLSSLKDEFKAHTQEK